MNRLLVAVLLGALGACSGDDGATTAAAATPETTVTTLARPVTTTSTSAPERLTADSRLRMDGIGPIRIGTTVAEASAAAELPIRVDTRPPFGPACQPATLEGVEGLALMVVDGRIARISVHRPSRVRTVSGVAIGDTEAEVHRIYGGRITVEPHVYNPRGHYLVYAAEDPSLRHLRLLFETDGRVVTTFRAGLERRSRARGLPVAGVTS